MLDTSTPTFWFLAVLISILIALLIYRAQRKESRSFEEVVRQEFVDLNERGFQDRMQGAHIIALLREMRDSVSELDDKDQIEIRIEELESRLRVDVEIRGRTLSDRDVLKHKALADKWSQLDSQHYRTGLLDEQGRLSVERLLSYHRTMFPTNSPWAGTIRTSRVFIVEQFGTQPAIVEPVTANTTVGTVDPDQILPNLDKLFEHWNSRVQEYRSCASQKQISATAKFHHDFELIHPFLDGNGRIGRILTSEQLSLLFEQRVFFDPDRDDYYHALRLMNLGENERFIGLINGQLEENGVRV